MPEYLAPGVYIEEVSSGSKPIEGVGTSTAGFIGATERGPEEPKFISSWLGFQRQFGGYIPKTSYLAYAVEGFFQNGGQRCFVARVASGNSALTTGAVGNLSVYAVGRGAWGNKIMIKVTDVTRSPEGQNWFRVFVLYYKTIPEPFVDPTDPKEITNKDRREPEVLEVYDNLTARPGAANNVVTVINTSSRLVRVAWAEGSDPAKPDNQAFTPLGDTGSDGDPLTASNFKGELGSVPGVPPKDADLLGQGRGLAAFRNR